MQQNSRTLLMLQWLSLPHFSILFVDLFFKVKSKFSYFSPLPIAKMLLFLRPFGCFHVYFAEFPVHSFEQYPKDFVLLFSALTNKTLLVFNIMHEQSQQGIIWWIAFLFQSNKPIQISCLSGSYFFLSFM